MKRILSLTLCLLVLVGAVSFGAGAVSLSAGRDRLIAQFDDGENSLGQDFAYYSPVKSKSDTTRYPLLVWLHGAGSGTNKRQQVSMYDMSNFASDEYQARFTQGGFFVLAPRDPGVLMSTWEANDTGTLKRTIDDFIAQHKANIDTDRIYITGYSTGGSMVWNMAMAYPNFFAAVVPSSALLQPGTAALSSLQDVSVWIFCSDRDPYPTASTTSARTTFNALKAVTNRPKNVRLSAFSQAVLPDGSKKTENGAIAWDCEHYTWMAITNDLHMYDGSAYKYVTTTDAAGNTVKTPATGGFLSWLSQQHRTTATSSDGGSSKGIFATLFGFLRSFVIRIFSLIRGLLTFA